MVGSKKAHIHGTVVRTNKWGNAGRFGAIELDESCEGFKYAVIGEMTVFKGELATARLKEGARVVITKYSSQKDADALNALEVQSMCEECKNARE